MSDDLIKFEINDQEYEARPGAMLIEFADEVGIHIPRFCYHKKLTVAANCRMCLVEVERAPKPMPACATPITAGLKVWTRSEKALAAQKDTMEFLLINHPLDCPICDQGGECELQDLSMAFGGSTSNYHEIKRVVRDKDIGELVATEMTRCIQCTRCVRFGEEIAGMREMGATGRGERMEIGTFVEKSLVSELSGNIIDICPVGALTAKPSRYHSRSWEMIQTPGVASHDSVGSSINLHTFKNKLVRVVAGDNEAINECWISDRDRFSYEGVNAADRVTSPMLKHNGVWKKTNWGEALEAVAEKLKSSQGEDVGVLVSPRASIEELYLMQKLMRAIGVNNIDHRLRQTDFNDQDGFGLFPWLGMDIAELEQQDAFLLVGANVRHDQPMINHRIRRAVMSNGAKVVCVNPRERDFNYEVSHQIVVSPTEMVGSLIKIAKACLKVNKIKIPDAMAALLKNVRTGKQDDEVASFLCDAQKSMVLLGSFSVQHPAYSVLRALSSLISESSGAQLGYLAESANTAGAWLAGAVPHRIEAGQIANVAGTHAGDMINNPKKIYVLLDVEPEYDCDNPQLARTAMQQAESVIVISPYASDNLLSYADIILPSSAFSETSGTYVNSEGRWQSFRAASKADTDVRPAWKILRVLGNKLEAEGFDYVSSSDVRDELRLICNAAPAVNNEFELAGSYEKPLEPSKKTYQRIGEVSEFSGDSLVRRATSLQKSAGDQQSVSLNSIDAKRLGLLDSETVEATQDNATVELALLFDESIPEGCALLKSGTQASSLLGSACGEIEITALT